MRKPTPSMADRVEMRILQQFALAAAPSIPFPVEEKSDALDQALAEPVPENIAPVEGIETLIADRAIGLV